MHLQEFALHEWRGLGELLLLHLHIENLVEERLQTGLRLLARHTGLETSEDFGPTETAAVEPVGCATGRQAAVHRDRHANLGRKSGLHTVKTRLADTDHCERIAVHHDFLAQDAAVARETALPVAVAEDRQRMATLIQIAGCREAAADCGADAQHAEEVAGDQFTRYEFGAPFK